MWPISFDIIACYLVYLVLFSCLFSCYLVTTGVVYGKANSDPRFYLKLLIKNLEAIPKFF